jgi:hypothetical protein
MILSFPVLAQDYENVTPPVYTNNTSVTTPGISSSTRWNNGDRITWQFLQQEYSDYKGSNLSAEQAKVVWDGLSSQYRDDEKKGIITECSYRAHFWCYQMDQKFKVNSYKLFLLYGAKYEAKNKDIWRYHVSPLVVVEGKPMVFDGLFLWDPKPINEWKNRFIDTGEDCEYLDIGEKRRNNNWFNRALAPGKPPCWYRVMPMYYFQPPVFKVYDKAEEKYRKDPSKYRPYRITEWNSQQIELSKSAFDFTKPDIPPEDRDERDLANPQAPTHVIRRNR